jgi:hypothetical protein
MRGESEMGEGNAEAAAEESLSLFMLDEPEARAEYCACFFGGAQRVL